MGWGLAAVQRNSLLQACTLEKEPGKTFALVVDMYATSRQMACGTSPRSARVVAKTLCQQFWTKCSGLLVLMYDDASRMHPIRSELHKVRYKALPQDKLDKGVAQGKIAVDGQLYTPDMVPYTKKEIEKFDMESQINWRRMWPTSHGKSCAFKLICEATIVWHHQHCKPGKKLIVWTSGTPVTYPYHDTETKDLAVQLCSNTYGEADGKILEAGKILCLMGHSVMLWTIDTDIILQVQASRAFSDNNELYLRLKNETIHAGRLVNLFGGDDVCARLSKVFFMLASAGCDYCKALTKFGFLSKELLGLVTSPSNEPVFELVDENRVLFDSNKFVALMLHTRRREKKKCTYKDLSDEVNRILFCVSYFGGANKTSLPYAGPPVPTTPLFDCDAFVNASSLSYLARNSHLCYNVPICID